MAKVNHEIPVTAVRSELELIRQSICKDGGMCLVFFYYYPKYLKKSGGHVHHDVLTQSIVDHINDIMDSL